MMEVIVDWNDGGNGLGKLGVVDLNDGWNSRLE